MLCSISGEIPQEPLVSTKTGHVFERRLIEKFLSEHHTCPITGQDLTIVDLIPLKSGGTLNHKARPVSATSIPSLISLFQSEWDTLMLETYSLKKQLDSTRQELSHALFQYDAASRLILKLIRERDTALSSLNSVTLNHSHSLQEMNEQEMNPESQNVAPVKSAPLPKDIVSVIDETSATLSHSRKKRTSKEAVNPEAMKRLITNETFELLQLDTNEEKKLVSVDIDPNETLIAYVNIVAPHKIVLFDLENKTLVKEIELKSDATPLKILFHPNQTSLFFSTKEGHIGLWNYEDGTLELNLIDKDLAIYDFTIHPSGQILVIPSRNRTWSTISIQDWKVISVVNNNSSSEVLNVLFHSDGILLASIANDDKIINIWDIRTGNNVGKLNNLHGPITGLAFSENGYHFSVIANGIINLWDLRKMAIIQTYDTKSMLPIHLLAFDNLGHFLISGSNSLWMLNVKPWEILLNNYHPITGQNILVLRFGLHAKKVYSILSDGTVQISEPGL